MGGASRWTYRARDLNRAKPQKKAANVNWKENFAGKNREFTRATWRNIPEDGFLLNILEFVRFQENRGELTEDER
jgi:hypothetical protein